MVSQHGDPGRENLLVIVGKIAPPDGELLGDHHLPRHSQPYRQQDIPSTGWSLRPSASYLRRPGDDTFRAFKLDALRIIEDQVAENTTFDARLFGAFELPELWSDELRQSASQILEPRR